MILTREEEAILEGEHGEGHQRAMELLVAVGEAFEALRLIPVTRAHAASSGQEGDLFFVEMLARGGARCKIPTTTNPVVNFDYFQKIMDMSQEHQEASVAWKVNTTTKKSVR